jgi:hypothetical protein
MPFTECAARLFTLVSIQKNAPESSGVYGLCDAREWLFVGESDNIRAHLLEHHRKITTVRERQSPMGFTFELCSPAARSARRQALVRELKPCCNRP